MEWSTPLCPAIAPRRGFGRAPSSRSFLAVLSQPHLFAYREHDRLGIDPPVDRKVQRLCPSLDDRFAICAAGSESPLS